MFAVFKQRDNDNFRRFIGCEADEPSIVCHADLCNLAPLVLSLTPPGPYLSCPQTFTVGR